jgi:orotidine-5'-phosphate decarboxylase
MWRPGKETTLGTQRAVHRPESTTATDAGKHIILALDVDSLDAARPLLESLRGTLATVKVGKELFTAEGPAAVRLCREAGFEVFLDLKYHDIPNTVAGAVRAASKLGVRWISLHVAGGAEMLRTAAAARDEAPVDRRPRLLGITVLTSLPLDDPEEVVERALLAQRCGLDGAVASPQEVARLRAACGPHFDLVIPGVRPAGVASDDQKRIATPEDALQDGASHLVIGRPIHAAANPRAAAQAIIASMAPVLEGRALPDATEADVAPRLLRMLKQSHAFFEGHFVLTSGLHSDRYVQCAQLLQYPERARRAGLWLAERLRNAAPDVVVSVALGGLVIGQEVAAALGVPALFAERDAEGVLRLRRGFELPAGARVAIVDDVCTKGGSIAECAELVRTLGADVVITGSIIDRSGGQRAFDDRFEALLQVDAEAVSPEQCDLCQRGVPTEKPGSRKETA